MITPPLLEDDEDFDKLANKLARQLSTAFGYSLREAENHIYEYYHSYNASRPAVRDQLKRYHGIEIDPDDDWTARDHFFHESSALVLDLGWRLAGGEPRSIEFLDWRKGCWQALENGEPVALPARLAQKNHRN